MRRSPAVDDVALGAAGVGCEQLGAESAEMASRARRDVATAAERYRTSVAAGAAAAVEEHPRVASVRTAG